MKNRNTFANRKTSRTVIFSLLIIVLVAITFSSCSDDDNAPAANPVPTNKDYLMSGKWYMQSTTYLALNECERQQYFLFNADNTITVKPMGSSDGVCTSHPLQTGTYEFSESNILTMSLGTNTTVLKIISITQNLMVGEAMVSGNPENVIFDKTEG